MKFVFRYFILCTGFVYVCGCSAEEGPKNKLKSPIERDNPEYEVVDYEYVKAATDNKEVLIIDVREPCEVKHGKIPNSINIPIGRLAEDLGPLSEEEFFNLYQRPKPSKDSEVIIYCKLGKRSTITSNQATDLGYTNIKNYVGSWTEWVSKLDQ